jgi:hypothetical protein
VVHLPAFGGLGLRPERVVVDRVVPGIDPAARRAADRECCLGGYVGRYEVLRAIMGSIALQRGRNVLTCCRDDPPASLVFARRQLCRRPGPDVFARHAAIDAS